MKQCTILFLAANPRGTDRLALDREARVIQIELERAGYRDCFELVTRWAVEPLDLLHELRKLKPTVVHFSGHGSRGVANEHRLGRAAHREVVGEPGGEQLQGLLFHGPDGNAQVVSTAAFENAFGAAGASVKLVILNACYTEAQAEALLAHVDCVVGTAGTIREDAARSFAIGFYGGIGEREPVANAYEQGLAAISLEGWPTPRPQLKVRAGVDARQLVLAAAPPEALPAFTPRTELIDFTAERQRHVRFIGREDVLAQLDEWLLGPDDAGWVVLTGGPGMGKSAIMSAWLLRCEAAGAVVPHHFVRRQVADWDQPEVIAGSLAAQLEVAFPDLRDPAAKPERRLLELLGRVSKQHGSSNPLVVVVDGLDETRADPGENPLPHFLPHVVPMGIRLLCAMRPTYPHLGWLEARSPVRRMDLDDPRWAVSNEAVVRGYWESVACEYQPALPAATVATAISGADGNILHAIMLRDALRDLPPPERRVDRIPRGLKRLIGEIWDRAASHPEVRVGLGLLCAAQEALSLDVLAELAGWAYDEKERFAREARQLLLEEPASGTSSEAYRPRHDWVRELIVERLGAATLCDHHRTLARTLATWPPRADRPRRSYAVRHALAHRIAVHDWTGVRALVSDLGYLEARAGAEDVFVVEQALRDAGRKCPEPDAARDLNDLAWALARESHWVRRDAKGTAGLIWNRLRRSGWTTDELDERMTVPEQATFLRVRHGASRESGSLERTLEDHRDVVRTCAVAPDGRRVVSGSDDGALKIWDLDTGRVLASLEGHTCGVTACTVTPEGRRVVSGSDEGILKVWDLDTGRVLATLDGHAHGVTACVVTPDGRHVVAGAGDGTLKVWDLHAGRIIATLEGHSKKVTACAITPDGERVVSASTDRTLKVWGFDGRVHVLATLADHGYVTACTVTPDGQRVVSVSTDGSLRIWDLDTGGMLATFDLHGHWPTAFLVTPDGRCVVSGSSGGMLTLWDLNAGCVLATYAGHAERVTACAVTPDGQRIVSASADRTLKIWDLHADRLVRTADGHTTCVNACAMAPDGRRVVTASHDRTLKVWDVHTGRVVATLYGHRDWVTTCVVTSDGRYVVSASADRTLQVWDLASGDPIATLAGRIVRERTARVSDRGKGYEEPRGRVEDALRVRATLDNLTASVRVCAVTPDGKRVISVSTSGSLMIWDFAGRVLGTLGGHLDGVLACAVTPDGRRLVSASRDGTLTIWDLDAGHALGTLASHEDAVNACAVTPEGRNVVSASGDATLKVWDLATGHVLATLAGHSDEVTACAVTPDGRYVLSTSNDRSVKVWDLASAQCLVTHRGDTAFRCVAATADAIVAGDRAGVVWFLDWPRSTGSIRWPAASRSR